MTRPWLLVPVLLGMLAALLLPAVQAAPPPDSVSAAVGSESGPLGDFMGMVTRDPHYEWKTNPAYPNGVNQAFYDEMGRRFEELGVKWVRIEIFAEEFDDPLTPQDERGKVNTAKYAYFINTVAPRHNLKVLALLATPLVRQRPENDPLYDPMPINPSDPESQPYPPGAYMSPERIEAGLIIPTSDYGSVNAYMQIWLDNAFTVASTFPYNKTTGAGIAAYEVLNEENRYLGGGGKGMDPRLVATLMTKFYRAFKKTANGPSGHPIGGNRLDVALILGGLHPDRCDDCASGGLNDRQYLDAIYKFAPAFQDFRSINGHYPLDGVGYHPYPMEMRSGLVPEPSAYNDLFRIPQRMQAIRNVMLQNGDAANKIWVTEIGERGAPVLGDPATSPRYDNEVRQANFMRTVYWMLWQQRAYVERVFWFKYEDFAVPRDDRYVGPENWGLVRIKPDPDTSYDVCDEQTKVCYTTRYDNNGTVQREKESYRMYRNIAFNGFSTYSIYMPQVGR